MNTTDILQSFAIICACIALIITNLCILDIKKDIWKLKDSAYFHDILKKHLHKQN